MKQLPRLTYHEGHRLLLDYGAQQDQTNASDFIYYWTSREGHGIRFAFWSPAGWAQMRFLTEFSYALDTARGLTDRQTSTFSAVEAITEAITDLGYCNAKELTLPIIELSFTNSKYVNNINKSRNILSDFKRHVEIAALSNLSSRDKVSIAATSITIPELHTQQAAGAPVSLITELYS